MPCCGVLIDFFLITNLNTNLWEITWYSLSVVLKCIRPVFVLSDVFDKQITAQRREVFVSGDGNCFYRAVAFRRNETGSEKREEIRRWSGSLFQKEVFELRLFAIFKYKNSHGFFNSKIFCSGVFGRSN